MKSKIALGAIGAVVLSVSFLLRLPTKRVEQYERHFDFGSLSLPEKADVIRASENEMRFFEIPWELDLFAGFRLAREENRPVFLYTVGGDPLGDC